MGTPNQ
ncbi:Protein of unknown function [Bacillus toyonensis]|nr:Protein of unknown function [Bacillus toyonensis]